MSDMNVCWNNLYRKLSQFHRWESVHVFINGTGKLDFLHLSKLVTAKFFRHLHISSNVLRQVFYCYTVYCDRFLQLFHELNLQQYRKLFLVILTACVTVCDVCFIFHSSSSSSFTFIVVY